MIKKILLWVLLAVFFLSVNGVGYMGDTRPYIVFVGILLFGGYLPRTVWRVIAIILAILILIKWEYYPYVSWVNPFALLSVLWVDVKESILLLIHGQFQEIAGSVRSIVFYGMMVYGTWFMEDSLDRPWWFFFILISGEWVLYLVSLLYSAKVAIFMVVFLLVGLVLLGVSHASRLVQTKTYGKRRERIRQMGVSVLLSVIVILFGALVPWIKTMGGRMAAGSSASTLAPTIPSTKNFNAHNNQLGGPFLGSSDVLLKVFANAPSYYRGEVLNTYTGTGWKKGVATTTKITSGVAIPTSILQRAGLVHPMLFSSLSMRVVVVKGSYPVWFSGYLPEKLTVIKGHGPLVVGNQTAQISGHPLLPGDEYVSVYRSPQVADQMLSGIQDGNQAYAYPQDLQLPSRLPERDIQLARRITAKETSTFGKVEAIIRYLDTHEVYQTANIPYLKPGQDFVDQFLFVTHRGYCDHFSSALAVLARAVGIPSRWVRGYVSVPPDPHYQGVGNEFLLRGTDAHSWVEIWYAGVGWVPMEATPSFSLPQVQPHSGGTVPQKATQQHPQPKSSRFSTTILSGIMAAVIAIIALLLILIVLSIWVFARVVRKRGQNADEVQKIDAVARVFYQFLRLIGGRKPHETLRETAQRIGVESAEHDMIKFIEWYERFRYGGQNVSVETGQKWLSRLRQWLHERHREKQ